MAVQLLCVVRWALSRRRRNGLMHALHGNGPAVRDEWQPAAATGRRRKNGGPGGGVAEAKLLQEPQRVQKLRAMGWELPDTVSDETVVQVYDVRLHP